MMARAKTNNPGEKGDGSTRLRGHALGRRRQLRGNLNAAESLEGKL